MNFPFRVLDLSDYRGFLCGRIFADLGFDVIKVERPHGVPAAYRGSVNQDIHASCESVYWLAYNMNKRCITLNIEHVEGKKIFTRLIKSSDFVIESFPPAYMDQLGLGYRYLRDINKRLIMTSISSFGKDGPYSELLSSDLINMAMGGLMYPTGDPDRPPVRVTIPQSYMIAGAGAAMATMNAHYHREISGIGQHVDFSIQAGIATVLGNLIPLYELNKINQKRMGSMLSGRASGTRQRTLWRCSDGYVAFFIMAGPIGKKTNQALVQWMDSEGMAPEYLNEMDWDAFDMATSTQEQQDKIEKPIMEFCLRHTKKEFLEEALKRGMNILPVSEPGDIVGNAQLEARNFWSEVSINKDNNCFLFPGSFVKFSDTPVKMTKKTPTRGEHNREIFVDELGFTSKDLERFQKIRVI